MKKNNTMNTSICPSCGCTYCKPPALSRQDNKALICHDCGTRQALVTLGVASDEQKQSIATIHLCHRQK